MTLSGQPPLQNAAELAQFKAFLLGAGVTRFLEVGSRYGDTLYEIGMALPEDSRLVSIDLPLIKPGKPDPKAALLRAAALLNARDRDCSVIFADSRNPETIDQADDLAPYDCVFIDGDHSVAGCTADFENYSLMARLVAFHDINPKEPKPGRSRIEVPEVWARVKAGRSFVEFKEQDSGGGIGIVWMR